MKIYDGDLLDTTNHKSRYFLQINSCGISRNEEGEAITLRQNGRADYHLFYLLEGECQAEYEGQALRLLPGELMLYPPHTPQRYLEFAHTKKIWLHFNGFGVPETLGEAGLLPGRHRVHSAAAVERRLLWLIAAFRQKEGAVLAKPLLYSLLFDLGAQIRKPETDDRLEECIAALTANFHTQVTTEELAARCALSESRFLHLFKERMGTSPHAYLQQLRLDSCRHLLLSTDQGIGEIARGAGYEDPLYFSRLFRRRFGLSPSEYRRGKAEKEKNEE